MSSIRHPDLDGTTLILGAGFSKAVSDRMPLMKDIGKLVAGELEGVELPGGGLAPDEDLEAWLSYALEDQPFLSEHENLLLRSHARRVLGAVHTHMVRAQWRTHGDGCRWLMDLVTMWHASRTNVISLNWDTIIEHAVSAAHLRDAKGETDRFRVASNDVLVHIPRPAVGTYDDGGAKGLSSFRLWKLHGSLDWYWNDGDRFGDTVVRRPSDYPSVLGDLQGIAGKSPFFAAPTATKSGAYVNHITRHIWQQARQALEQSERLVFIGYSFPKTDLVVRSLLRCAAPSVATIVDLDESPASSAKELFGEGVDVRHQASVESFVSSLRGAYQGELRGRLEEFAHENEAWEWLTVVSVRGLHLAPIVGVSGKGDGVRLELGDSGNFRQVARVDAPDPLTLKDLIEGISPGSRPVVEVPEGDERIVYGIREATSDIGKADGRWIKLMCAGEVPTGG